MTPRQLLAIAGDRLPSGYRRPPGRYRYGPGVFKLDWALDGADPVARPECARAGDGPPRRHARGDRRVGGGACSAGEHARAARSCCSRSRASSTRRRAPAGKHTAWAYCHVPERLDRRHDRPRSRRRSSASRPASATSILARHAMIAGRDGAPQRQLRRRRHQRRGGGPAPALHAPGRAPRPVHDAGSGPLHLLVVDAARRRRPRHVRLLRGRSGGAATGFETIPGRLWHGTGSIGVDRAAASVPNHDRQGASSVSCAGRCSRPCEGIRAAGSSSVHPGLRGGSDEPPPNAAERSRTSTAREGTTRLSRPWRAGGAQADSACESLLGALRSAEFRSDWCSDWCPPRTPARPSRSRPRR